MLGKSLSRMQDEISGQNRESERDLKRARLNWGHLPSTAEYGNLDNQVHKIHEGKRASKRVPDAPLDVVLIKESLDKMDTQSWGQGAELQASSFP